MKIKKELRLYVDSDFDLTLRKKYPFIKSVSSACNLLNKELKEVMGITNDKIFKVKKR